jgi:Holliday junction resolvase RusA-like endonuclease
MITFIIPGKPQGKDRPRMGRGFVYTTPKTRAYERAIQLVACEAMKGEAIIEDPVSVNIDIFAPIPESWSNKKKLEAISGLITPTVKPDLDNIAKVVLDSMNKIVYDDDKQVVKLSMSKEYSSKPRIGVYVYEMQS